MSKSSSILICSPLEREHVERIAAVDPRLQVRYEPDLLPRPRYEADHGGVLPDLTEEQQAQWLALAAQAQIAFDFDRRDPAGMPANFPRLEWLQATSAGLGDFRQRFPLDLDRIVVTTAAGVHAQPLAEFVVAGLLHFVKGFPQLAQWQREHRWTRYTTDSLAGKRVLVVGVGAVGKRTAAVLAALGAEVTGVLRSPTPLAPPGVSSTITYENLRGALPGADAIVLCCPLTDTTRGLLGAEEFAAVQAGTLLVNIARGEVVDEAAMIDALRSGQLGGAVLDVASVEPLPEDSPLWDLPNVVISPHSASTVRAENARITDLFCDNLRRWLDGRELINRYRPELGY